MKQPSSVDEPQQLLRKLGPYMAIAMVVGNVIGSGIFYKPGNIAAASGNFTLIISVWIAGGLLCVFGAMCFAELGTMFPHAGGIYVYLKHAYGELVAFLFGWTEFVLLRPASIGALAVAFIGSFTLAMGWQASDLTQWLLCSALILMMAWINVLGVIWGGRMQLVTTLLKVGFLALVALAPFWTVPFAGWMVSVSNFESAPATSENAGTFGAQIAMVLLAVMWAYDGWHGITPLAEEVRDPQQNIPLALFGGIGILVVLYVAANVAYHSVMSMAEMRASGDHAAEQMLGKLSGNTGRAAISGVIMCSTFGAINSNILMAPRIPFAMGRDGLFPKSLGRVHPHFRTPAIAIIVTSLMAIGLIGLISIGKAFVEGTSVSETTSMNLWQQIVQSLQNDSTFSLLTNCFVFVASLFYALAVVAVIVLRYRLPNADRPYRTWCYPVVPVVFSTVYLWFLAQIYSSNPAESRTGMLLIALGIPIFFAMRR
ncbi:MAG: amino acid permease [Planctomycetales bacterium]|nr:amino acid permease [Planctomycetales bacterium]